MTVNCIFVRIIGASKRVISTCANLETQHGNPLLDITLHRVR